MASSLEPNCTFKLDNGSPLKEGGSREINGGTNWAMHSQSLLTWRPSPLGDSPSAHDYRTRFAMCWCCRCHFAWHSWAAHGCARDAPSAAPPVRRRGGWHWLQLVPLSCRSACCAAPNPRAGPEPCSDPVGQCPRMPSVLPCWGEDGEEIDLKTHSPCCCCCSYTYYCMAGAARRSNTWRISDIFLAQWTAITIKKKLRKISGHKRRQSCCSQLFG